MPSSLDMNPCPGCGKPMQLDDATMAECVERKARLDAEAPGLSAYIHNLPYWCLDCLTLHEDQRKRKAEKRRAEMVRLWCYESGALPQTAEAAHFSDAGTAYVARNAAVWASLERCPLIQSAWLYGPPGVGKTYLAHCVANRYLDVGEAVAHVAGIELAGIRSWDTEKVKRWFDVPLLIVDDIATPRWDAQGLDALWRLIDKRHGRQSLRHIITANVDPNHFRRSVEEQKGPAFARALVERFIPMKAWEMQGKSIRVEQMELDTAETPSQSASERQTAFG